MRILALSLGVAGLVACAPASVDLPIDDDGDGITSDIEEEIGTDPFEPDTDGDGHMDGSEFDQGTDPLDPSDHPYFNDWPIDSECRNSIDGTGYSLGDIANQFELTSQFGDTVKLHDFCGHAVLLAYGAFW